MDFSKIKAFVFDVDGVFTDGGVYCFPDGDFIRRTDAKDGFAIRMASMNGYFLGVITGGASLTIRMRLKACGIPEENIYLCSRDKEADMIDFCSRFDLSPEEVCYVGDDCPDVPVANMVGLPACPADAVDEMKDASRFVATHGGGHGAVREIVETVMKAQDRWTFDVGEYKRRF